MKALRFEDGALSVADVPVPDRHDEAIVRVTLAGICSTDLQITRGYAGFNGTLGHEFVGVVERSPDRGQIGRRVVGEINAGCGACELCREGDPRHCARRTVLGIHERDGAFAEYVSLPPGNLLAVPDELSDRQAVFVEPLAAACEILDQVSINDTHRVAVIGDGKLGQLIARVLATTGCELKMIGKHVNNLRLASDAGIRTVLAEDGRVDAGARCDFVVEASGAASGLQLAVDLARPRGTIILKSTFHGAVPFETWRIVVDELTVIGSRCGRFTRAIELLRSGDVDVKPLIAGEYPLESGVAAMTAASQPGTLKVLLKP